MSNILGMIAGDRFAADLKLIREWWRWATWWRINGLKLDWDDPEVLASFLKSGTSWRG